MTTEPNPYLRTSEYFLFEYIEASRNKQEIECYDVDFNRGCWQMAVAKVKNNEQPDYTKLPFKN